MLAPGVGGGGVGSEVLKDYAMRPKIDRCVI